MSKLNLEADRTIVSIGMFVYNGEKYIEQSLKSILSQSFKDFELIIADNCSSDNTQTICQQYASLDKRVKYIRHEENIGIFNNFRFVRDVSKQAEYFMWAAYDDLWEENWLEEILNNFTKDDLCVRGKTVNVDEFNNPLWVTPIKSFKKGDVVRSFLDDESNGRGLYWYGVFNYSRLKKINLNSLDNVFGSDTFFITHLVQFGNMRVINSTSQYYRQHQHSTTKKFSADWFGLRRYIYHLFPFRVYLYVIQIVSLAHKPKIIILIPIKYLKTILSLFNKLIKKVIYGKKYK